MNIFFKYFLAWFPMLILAIANGALRDLVYKKHVGELTAHQISTITLFVLFVVYITLVVKLFPPDSGKQALFLGIGWACMTLSFEFGFGKYRGNSWEKLFSDYNLLQGHIWLLIPLTLALYPYAVYHLIRR